MKIKKGDNVIVIAGKDKGTTGKVATAFPRLDKVLIDGVNMRKKHQKARKTGEKGQILDVAFPIHVSNVMLVDADGKRTRKIGGAAKTVKVPKKASKKA